MSKSVVVINGYFSQESTTPEEQLVVIGATKEQVMEVLDGVSVEGDLKPVHEALVKAGLQVYEADALEADPYNGIWDMP